MHQEVEGFRRLVADVSETYHGLDVSASAPVRLPQILSPAQTPGTNGEFLVSCLYTISLAARDRFEAIEDALRAVFPTFVRMDFPLVAAGRGTLAWQEREFTRPFYANELSEGTLRFLWLATLLQSPRLPQITLIDEPEVSLHPEKMLHLLADLMREASDRTQLIVATHSDRFVRFWNQVRYLYATVMTMAA
jgi:predicted ATPase